MKFSISKSSLVAELGVLQTVIEKKSTIPILSNVLIESLEGGKIRMTGTDLDTTIYTDFEANVVKPGVMCIQARKLIDIVRQLPTGCDIHFSQEPNFWVKILCERSNFKVAGSARDNFPETPRFPSGGIELSSKLLASFISHTSFAITTEQSRFTLSGAKFLIQGNVIKMVTTDGHRLALVGKDAGGARSSNELDTLIPKKALTEIARILKLGDAETVYVSEDLHHIFFTAGDRRLIARKLNGNFPNYEMVFPKDNDKNVRFCANDLKAAIARVSLMADEKTQNIKLTVMPDAIVIRAKSSEEGEGSETINAEYSGEEVDINFNARYVLDFLSLDGEESAADDQDKKPATCRFATMNFKNTTSQTLFSYENFAALQCIIMPTKF
jgi:DNA polymerase-3 subunit beta